VLVRAHGSTGRCDAHSSILIEGQKDTKMEILFLKRIKKIFYVIEKEKENNWK